VARLLVFLLSFTAVFCGYAGARDTYYIGFLGNSNNASSSSLYDTLSLAIESANNTSNSYEMAPVFFSDEAPNAADEIRGRGNLLALIGCFSEKDAAVLEKIENIPLISAGKNFVMLNEKGKNNVFRVCPSEAQLAEDLCRFGITVLGKNKAAIVYSEGSADYLRAAEAFAANARANRVWSDYFKSVPADRTDFTNILLRLRDLKVQMIYFAGSMEQAAEFARKSQEMNVGATFMTTDNVNSRVYIKKAKTGADRTVFASIIPATLNGFKGLKPFMAQYRKKYSYEDVHLPYVYDAANMVFSALAAGKKSGQDVAAYMCEKTHSGVTGSISFGASGLRKNADAFFYIIARKEVLYRKLQDSEAKKYWEAK
jgi:ABC-type branched-subunit amino acid transport system substrate-binding protein